MTKSLITIQDRCAHYLEEEPDDELKAQVAILLHDNNEEELRERFDKHLRFGTAGLRARMEAGYNRMNRVSIYRFAHALAQSLLQFFKPSVVIGFDGRNQSDVFAKEIASILEVLKISVYLFDQALPTPLCAFAVKYLKVHAGIMVTASHNPKMDNGIKLYDSQGVQAPKAMLSVIESQMDVAPSRTVFFAHSEEALRATKAKMLSDEIIDAYLKAITHERFFIDSEMDKNIDVVYTPLHGVGKNTFLKALNKEGFPSALVVNSQAEPDGDFPTVMFPNPEEDHTLDCAHALAKEKKISWVFAHDPDADRLQVSCVDDFLELKKLTGNEMGTILGYFAIKNALYLGKKPLVASSIVSSRMLRTMSERLGAHYVESLTGFGNIVAKALEQEAKTSHQFVFAYEEALGFLIGKTVLDKDGISAGTRFMEIAAYLKAKRQTVWQFLDELSLTFGLFVTEQWSIRFDDIFAMAKMREVMSLVRRLKPKEVAGIMGEGMYKKEDLLEPSESYSALQSDVIIFDNESSARLVVRPSGTEPKIKFYLEVKRTVSDSLLLPTAKRELLGNAQSIRKKIEQFVVN